MSLANPAKRETSAACANGGELRIALIASHDGTTAQAVLDACASGAICGLVALVITNNANAGVLGRAEASDVPWLHLSGSTHPEPVKLDRAMADSLMRANVDVVVLAGYMKRLGPQTLGAFMGRIINTHPALLPEFGGQGMYGDRIHEAVIAAGAQVSGASVHLVTDEYDAGRVLCQQKVRVLPNDDFVSLGQRVRFAERALLVQTLAAWNSVGGGMQVLANLLPEDDAELGSETGIELSEDPCDKTVKTYRDNFEKYVGRTPETTLGEFKEWLDFFASHLPKGGLILEIGSASGRDARHFSAEGFKVFCTDVIPEALRRLSDEGFETEEFDFRNPPRPEWVDKFDGVFANAVLLHAPPNVFESALRSIALVLKEGGIAALSLKVGEGEEISIEKLEAPRYFRYHSEPEIREILSGLPFEAISIAYAEHGKWLHVVMKYQRH